MAKRWVKLWGSIDCKAVNQQMIEKFLFKRTKVSAFTANKEIRYLKATLIMVRKGNWLIGIRLMELDFSQWKSVSRRYPLHKISTSIQRILGHECRTTTEIYLHRLGDSKRVAIGLYESAREKSHTDSHTKEKGL